MLSSPYPVPPLRFYQAITLIGYICGIVAGAWVMADPPKSYDSIGLTLTITWGAMIALGSSAATIGHAFRRYRLELPGILLVLGGVAIYVYLSWVQVFTTSPGSGPRALLLMLLGALIAARVRVLLHIDREGRRLAALRTVNRE